MDTISLQSPPVDVTRAGGILIKIFERLRNYYLRQSDPENKIFPKGALGADLRRSGGFLQFCKFLRRSVEIKLKTLFCQF